MGLAMSMEPSIDVATAMIKQIKKTAAPTSALMMLTLARRRTTNQPTTGSSTDTTSTTTMATMFSIGTIGKFTLTLVYESEVQLCAVKDERNVVNKSCGVVLCEDA